MNCDAKHNHHLQLKVERRKKVITAEKIIMSTTTTHSGHNNSVPVQITEEKGKLPGGVRKKLTITPFCPQNARNVNK